MNKKTCVNCKNWYNIKECPYFKHGAVLIEDTDIFNFTCKLFERK